MMRVTGLAAGGDSHHVNDTVISKEPKRGLDVILNVIYEDEKESRINDGPLGNARSDIPP